MKVKAFALSLLMCCLLISGCGPAESLPGEVPVYPINGILMLDGQPAENIQIALHSNDPSDSEKKTYPQGFSNAHGQVKISTYADGDGAPAGEYRVTLTLKRYNAVARSFDGPDQLGGKYADPKTTPIELHVGPDLPNELGRVELTTK